MDMDGAVETDSLSNATRRRSKTVYQFTQQSLPACKHVLTPAWVISTFLLMGALFIPVGLVALHASKSVVEIVDRYDLDCIKEPYRSNKVAYIKDSSISKNCTRVLKVPKHMKAPIFIYYQLDNYFQNHRRYVKSRSDKQLLYGLKYNDTSSCEPEAQSHGLPIVPCGLVAWSLFNETYSFSRGNDKLNVNKKDIAWKSDRDHKFGKEVKPFNFQSGELIDGGKLDPDVPVVPVALMLTPNQSEAEQLTGLRVLSEGDGREACNILAAGPSKIVDHRQRNLNILSRLRLNIKGHS